MVNIKCVRTVTKAVTIRCRERAFKEFIAKVNQLDVESFFFFFTAMFFNRILLQLYSAFMRAYYISVRRSIAPVSDIHCLLKLHWTFRKPTEQMNIYTYGLSRRG